eukprot:2082597-Rhodomonas_salina.1
MTTALLAVMTKSKCKPVAPHGTRVHPVCIPGGLCIPGGPGTGYRDRGLSRLPGAPSVALASWSCWTRA